MNPHVEALREWCKNREAAGPIEAILGTLEAYDALQSQHDEAVAACAVMREALKTCSMETLTDIGWPQSLSTDCGRAFLERMKEAEESPVEDELKKWRVEVSNEDNSVAHYWTVLATTEDDAIQLAFALDGGWNTISLNATGMIELAKTYCKARLLI